MLYLFRPFRARGKKFKSQQPWFSSLQSVRDCSGILCGAKIERKARRVAERPDKDYSQRTTDNRHYTHENIKPLTILMKS